MKRKLLMPHWCKVIGWIVMLPLGVAGIFWVSLSLIDLFELSESPEVLTKMLNFIEENLELYITLLSLSMLMVAFSREKDEDEYVAAVRSHYLMLAFYIDVVFLVITAFAVPGLAYLVIMELQMFLILLLHIIMFNIAMAVIRKKRGHEE